MSLVGVFLAAGVVGMVVAADIVFQDVWTLDAQYTFQQGLWVALLFALPVGAFIGFLAALVGLALAAMLSKLESRWNLESAGAAIGVFVVGAAIIELVTAMNALQHFEMAWWIAYLLSALGAFGLAWWVRVGSRQDARG